MNQDDNAGEHLRDVYITRLKLENIYNLLIKSICDEFPEEERFIALGRLTNALIDTVYKPVIKTKEGFIKGMGDSESGYHWIKLEEVYSHEYETEESK